jgi:hypothetical protein
MFEEYISVLDLSKPAINTITAGNLEILFGQRAPEIL